MSNNQWGDNRYISSLAERTRVSTLFRQTFALAGRGYFRCLAMSSPAYIILLIIGLLYAKNAHIITTHTVVYQSGREFIYTYRRLATSNYQFPLTLLTFIMFYWGQVFSMRSMAASYFAYDDRSTFDIKVPGKKIMRGFLVSLLIAIVFVIGLILLVIPGVIWLLLVYPIAAIIVLENQFSITDTFRRSRELTRQNMGRIFLLQIYLFITTAIMYMAIGFVAAKLGASLFVLLSIFSFAYILTLPFYTASSLVVYCDLRYQKENIRPDELANSIGIPLTRNKTYEAPRRSKPEDLAVVEEELPPFPFAGGNSSVEYNWPAAGDKTGNYRDANGLIPDLSGGGEPPFAQEPNSQNINQYPYSYPDSHTGNQKTNFASQGLPDDNSRVELGYLQFRDELPTDPKTDDSGQSNHEGGSADGKPETPYQW